MKTELRNILLLFLVMSMTIGCTGKWTEKDKELFLRDCLSTTKLKIHPISFTGFDFSSDSIVKVIEWSNGQITNSFSLKPRINRNESVYWASVNDSLDTSSEYEFRITDEVYQLTDLEKVMWPQFTMTSEDYGCKLGNFKINDEIFEMQGNIWFRKKGTTDKWDN